MNTVGFSYGEGAVADFGGSVLVCLVVGFEWVFWRHGSLAVVQRLRWLAGGFEAFKHVEGARTIIHQGFFNDVFIGEDLFEKGIENAREWVEKVFGLVLKGYMLWCV